MVDPDPGYRPRRAYVDPAAPVPEPPEPAERRSAELDSDDARPLFREEALEGTAGASSATGPTAGTTGEPSGGAKSPNFRARTRRTPEDDDSTTLLARTPAGGRRGGPAAEDELDEDERGRRRLGQRARLALLVGALAAVVAVGLAIGYAVVTVGDPTAGPGPALPSGAATGSTPPGTDPGAALADSALLSPQQAATIADGAWTVALTQRSPAADAPTPACTSDEPTEGDPIPQQEVVRLLSSSGDDAPSALHQAARYASPEEAAQAYAVAARTFGGCVAAGAYIVSGATVAGLGDQAAGLEVSVVAGGEDQRHSIVLSRAGSVLNVVDAVQAEKAPRFRGVVAALAAVTEGQCRAAGTPCSTDATAEDGPPPLGGDVPGFLATGDLPPVGEADEGWVATPAELPSPTFFGSGCETVNWARVDAETASTRVYLVASSTEFGLNDIVLTLDDEEAAGDLVAKIRSDLDSCEERKLTATVSDPEEVDGVGAQSATVTGWTSTVEQKSIDGTERYRVGIVSSGAKVAYTFLSPQDDGYDLTDEEWDRVAVRAGQRMTQVP